MKQPLGALAVTLAIAVAACAHLGKRAQLPPVGAADSGKTIELAVGQEMTIRLDVNLGTGYRWQTVTEPDARTVIVVNTGYDRADPHTPGASGQAWWKLRATGSGETSIALRYGRPWVPDESAKEFTLKLVVK